MYYSVLSDVRNTVNFSGDAQEAMVDAILAGNEICRNAGVEARNNCLEEYPGETICYRDVEVAVQNGCFQSFGQLFNEWSVMLPFHVQNTQIVRTCTAIDGQRQAGNCQF